MDVFEALAAPTRREIIEVLSNKGTLTASDISARFDMSAPAISQHLKILREAKLVRVERQGQMRIYRIDPTGMAEFEQWAQKMRRLWDKRFDSLDKVLQAEKKKLKTQTEKEKKS